MLRRALTASFLLAVAHSMVNASDGPAASLTVRVEDPQGGGVAGAIVMLDSRDGRVRVSAVSDTSGSYRFVQIAPGDYLVQANAPGFARSQAAEVHVTVSSAPEVRLRLELPTHVEQVVVTASATAQTVDEVSKALTVVDRQEIEARDEYSIPEVLRTVPGLRVQQLGGPGSLTSIKMRGLRNEHTSVLVDGFRIRDAASTQGDATAFMELLIATDLERVEVLRGSGSSLYGTHAVGGVINLITAEGGGGQRGTLVFEGGSLDVLRGQAQIAGGIRGDRVTYSAGLAHLHVGTGVDGDDGSRNTSVQGRLRARLTPTTTLSGRVYIADGLLSLNESPFAVGDLPRSGIIDARPIDDRELLRYESGVPVSDLIIHAANFMPSANDPDDSRDTRFSSVVFTFEQRPSERFSYSVNYHGLASRRDFVDGPMGVGFEPSRETRSDFDGRIDTLNLRGDFQWGLTSTVTAGYELERESFENRSAPDDRALTSTVDVSQKSHSFFVQDQTYLAGGALQLSGGLRAQVFSLSAPSFDPESTAPYGGIELESPPNAYTADASVAYGFRTTGTKIRAHLGNGYRAPSLYERFGTFFGPFGYSILGDPGLGPERSVAFDAGVDQQWNRGRFRAHATFFFTRLKEAIVFDFSGGLDPATDPFGRYGGYRMGDGGAARGAELGAGWNPFSGLHLAVAYTLSDSDVEPSTVVDEVLPQALTIPRHSFSMVVTQQVTRDFYLNLDLSASSDYLAPIFDPGTFTSRTYRFGGLAKLDVGASTTVPFTGASRLRLFGKLENLLDSKYYESGFRIAGRMVLAGVAVQF